MKNLIIPIVALLVSVVCLSANATMYYSLKSSIDTNNVVRACGDNYENRCGKDVEFVKIRVIPINE